MTTVFYRKHLERVSVAVLLSLATAVPAVAGDSVPGLKGSLGAGHRVTHVPAPAPVPEYSANYYIGLDAGFSFSASGTISSQGLSGDVREHDDTSNLLHGGFRLGRYFNDNVRGDLTFSFRPNKGIFSGETFRQATVTAEGPDLTVPSGTGTQTVQSLDTHILDVRREEQARFQFQTGLANLYYDFKNHSRFTPYVGAGAGVVLYTFEREANETSTCHQTINSFQDPVTGQTIATPTVDGTGAPACVRPPETGEVSNSGTSVAWGYALALTTGLAVDLTETSKFDIGYRFLYTSGNVSLGLPDSFGGASNIDIEDRIDHELRVGLRWDIE